MTDFMEVILQAASETIPRTSPNPGRRALPWWSSTTKEAVKARRKALRAVKRLPLEHPNREASLALYRSKRNECRQTIREAKQQSWENLLNGISSEHSASEIWGRINAISGKRRSKGMALQYSGTTTRDPAIIVDILGEHFADLSAIGNYSEHFRRTKTASTQSLANITIPEEPATSDINRPFRLDELTLALSKARGSSAGPDEVGYPLFQNLPPAGKLKLLELFNQIWSEDSIPHGWTHSLCSDQARFQIYVHASQQ